MKSPINSNLKTSGKQFLPNWLDFGVIEKTLSLLSLGLCRTLLAAMTWWDGSQAMKL